MMEFSDDTRLARHMNTHKRRELKGTRSKQNVADFEKPDFTQVNI